MLANSMGMPKYRVIVGEPSSGCEEPRGNIRNDPESRRGPEQSPAQRNSRALLALTTVVPAQRPAHENMVMGPPHLQQKSLAINLGRIHRPPRAGIMRPCTPDFGGSYCIHARTNEIAAFDPRPASGPAAGGVGQRYPWAARLWPMQFAITSASRRRLNSRDSPSAAIQNSRRCVKMRHRIL